MTLNPRLGRFQKSPSFQSAVNHPLARTPVSTTTRASTSEPGTAARVEPRRAFHRKAPLARVPAAARPAPLPPRSPARPRSQARLGLRALLGLTRGAPGMTPGLPKDWGSADSETQGGALARGKPEPGVRRARTGGSAPHSPSVRVFLPVKSALVLSEPGRWRRNL